MLCEGLVDRRVRERRKGSAPGSNTSPARAMTHFRWAAPAAPTAFPLTPQVGRLPDTAMQVRPLSGVNRSP